MKSYRLDEDEARRMRDEFFDGALPILEAEVLQIVWGDPANAPEEIAAVRLDASGRPDVADLSRVIQADGIQTRSADPNRYVRCEGKGYMVLSTRIIDPVAITFKFVLTWPDYDHIFQAILRTGALYTTTEAFAPAFANGRALGCRVERHELEAAMGSWFNRA